MTKLPTTLKEAKALAVKVKACKFYIDLIYSCDTVQELQRLSRGSHWVHLLQVQPEFGSECDWSKLDGFDWSCLLRVQPQFSSECDWSKLDGYSWTNLLRDQPQFSSECDWSKLDSRDWSNLLRVQPQLVAHRVNK